MGAGSRAGSSALALVRATLTFADQPPSIRPRPPRPPHTPTHNLSLLIFLCILPRFSVEASTGKKVHLPAFWSAAEVFFNLQEPFGSFVSHESLLECIIINSHILALGLFFFELKASSQFVLQKVEKKEHFCDQKYFSNSQSDIDLDLGWK